jgi:hypothetical protein
VFLFGGVDLSTYNGYVPYAQGWIFQGGVKLALDTALLIATGYRPVAGPVGSSGIDLAPFASTTTTVTLRGYSGELLALVDSESIGVVYTYWQGDLSPGIGATASTDP